MPHQLPVTSALLPSTTPGAAIPLRLPNLRCDPPHRLAVQPGCHFMARPCGADVAAAAARDVLVAQGDGAALLCQAFDVGSQQQVGVLLLQGGGEGKGRRPLGSPAAVEQTSHQASRHAAVVLRALACGPPRCSGAAAAAVLPHLVEHTEPRHQRLQRGAQQAVGLHRILQPHLRLEEEQLGGVLVRRQLGAEAGEAVHRPAPLEVRHRPAPPLLPGRPLERIGRRSG